jgi:hypothetical protein
MKNDELKDLWRRNTANNVTATFHSRETENSSTVLSENADIQRLQRYQSSFLQEREKVRQLSE